MNADADTRYGRVAAVYDALGTLYSAGAISRAKRESARFVAPGSTVLYAGAGTGEEAVLAARAGARVTLLDSSKAMLARAKARFDREQEGVAHAPVFAAQTLEAHRPHRYDVVVASFFLNVFSEPELPRAQACLCDLVRAGGRLVVVDFAAPRSSRAFAALQRAYYLPPLGLFHLLTHNPWHPLYDYGAVMAQIAPAWGAPERLVVPALGLPLFELLSWTRPGEQP